MSLLDPCAVLAASENALKVARDWARRHDAINRAQKCEPSDGRQTLVPSNRARSVRFCSDLCGELDNVFKQAFPQFALTKRHVGINEDGKGKAGEWLLDGAWTIDNCQDFNCKVPGKVKCALECESSTNVREFFTDFAKLVVVLSPIKLFFAGLNQLTPVGAKGYIDCRIAQTEKFIQEHEEGNPEWYLGFWPSPLMHKGGSLWTALDGGEYSHIDCITLYKLTEEQKFCEIQRY